MTRAGRGHRLVPHTADIRIEAWGPTREICLAESATALVTSFADVSGAEPQRCVLAELAADSDEDCLLALLDEIIYRLDTEDTVALGFEVSSRPGGIAVRMPLTGLDRVECTGAAPKAVALQDLQFAEAGGTWRCAATIDV